MEDVVSVSRLVFGVGFTLHVGYQAWRETSLGARLDWGATLLAFANAINVNWRKQTQRLYHLSPLNVSWRCCQGSSGYPARDRTAAVPPLQWAPKKTSRVEKRRNEPGGSCFGHTLLLTSHWLSLSTLLAVHWPRRPWQTHVIGWCSFSAPIGRNLHRNVKPLFLLANSKLFKRGKLLHQRQEYRQCIAVVHTLGSAE